MLYIVITHCEWGAPPSPAVGWLLCRRSQHTTVRALLFSGMLFFVSGISVLQVARGVTAASKSLVIIYLSDLRLYFTLFGRKIGIWWNIPGGVRWLGARWQLATRDLVFAKPLADLRSILGDDYNRPGTPYKNPIIKISFLRRD